MGTGRRAGWLKANGRWLWIGAVDPAQVVSRDW